MTLRAVSRHLGRNSVAYLALFVALSGSAVAAATLAPKNSVGTRQVINHSLTRKDVRAGQAPRGAPGLQGAAGPAGLPGISGPQGPQAALTGSAGGPTQDPPPLSANTFETTSITLPASGKLLLLARLDSMSIYCGMFACSYGVGVYLDGKPVPGSGYVVAGSCSSPDLCAGFADNISVAAVATGVTAGTHQLLLGGAGGSFFGPPAVGKVALAAVALG